MKKFLFILTVILLYIQQGQAQQQTWTQDFDGSLSGKNWVADSNLWIPNTLYTLPGSSATNPKSILGFVPNRVGDSTTLVTDIYDCTSYQFVYLRFNHICKIASSDVARIEYREDVGGGQMGRWQVIPGGTYQGAGTYRTTQNFNASSYAEWTASNNTVLPKQSWWKEESFDLQVEAGFQRVQFRFVIKHGNVAQTQVSYGWLLENFRLEASTGSINYPTVQFTVPYVRDQVYSIGPYEINAKVKTRSTAPIEIPYLKYTATHNGIFIASDSLNMIHLQGDSIWKVNIPSFELGTKVVYSVTGKDTLGNEAITYSEYIITAEGETNIILQDEGTSRQYYPFYPSYGYSRSMALYTLDEIDNVNAAGLISSISLRCSTIAQGSFPMKIYLKTVPVSKTVWTSAEDNVDWSVHIQDATLVYDGDFNFNTVGWIDIPLHVKYQYSRTENLVVLFEQNCGGSSCSAVMGGTSYPYFHNKTMPVERFWQKYADGNPPIQTTTLYVRKERPDLRIKTVALKPDDNSAALYSIDMADTTDLDPNFDVPVVVTIKNKGVSPLNFATLSYSINGVHQKDTLVHFTPALTWDFNKQLTLGSYTQRTNRSDTLVVWVKLPNGQNDSTTWDDTLTKHIYGRTDIVMDFILTPDDTVETVGPHEIRARIYSISGAPMGIPELLIKSTLEGSVTYDTLAMSHLGSNIWMVQIPSQLIGSDVQYTVKGTDVSGNEVEISNGYHIKHPSTNQKYVIIGTGTSGLATNPYAYNSNYSYSRNYYMSYEIDHNRQGGYIKSVAFYNTQTALSNVDSIAFYFKAVTDSINASVAYLDPLTDGAVLVWGKARASTNGIVGWVTFNLNTPFYLSPNMNLLIYCDNYDGSSSGNGNATYRYTPTGKNTSVYVNGTTWPPTTTTINGNRPNVRLLVGYGTDPFNSVALETIEVPQKTTLADIPTYPHITIRNKGMANLDSCYINWKLNGVQQPVTVYRKNGGLPEDFSDTITLSSFYIPVVSKTDTIEAWVSMPNGIMDTIHWDDTLRITSFGCEEILSGNVKVGPGQHYTSFDQVFNILRTCGLGGDITLQLKGKINERLDLTNLSNIMQGYHLTITSLGNHPDSAVIELTSGTAAAFILNNTTKLTIKALTIDVSTLTVPAIHFTGACTNVLIRDCKLLGNPTTQISSTTNAPIAKVASTGVVDSIFFINNLINGGYYGWYFYGGTGTTAYGKNIVFDSNKVSNQYQYGAYSYYAELNSRSNYIIPRSSEQSVSWYGIYAYYTYNGNLVGNRVYANNSGITTTLVGIQAYYTNNTMIANNEVRLFSEAGTTSGLIMDYPTNARIYHNTIYTKKNGTTGTNRAHYNYINATATENATVKNNIFVAEGGAVGTTYAFYFGGTAANLARATVNYNNYYSDGTNIGYVASAARTDLASWMANMPGDINSVNIRPSFVDTARNLKLKDYTVLFCPLLPEVTYDIDSLERIRTIPMGCYQILRFDNDANLVRILGVEEGVAPGQPNQSVSVIVENTGFDTLKSLQLEWLIDGTSVGVVDASTLSLDMGESDTIVLGDIPLSPVDYTRGDHTIKVQVNSVNAVLDERPSNDTIETLYLSCSAALSGPYIIDTSSTGDFPNIAKAITQMRMCGISGKVTLQLKNGTYNESIDFSRISITGNDTLELTSLSGNADSVIIATNTFGIKTGNSDNVYIKNITINLAGEGHGILLGAGDNIEINGCKINLDSTIARYMTGNNIGSRHVGICKLENSGIANNVRILNNEVIGGYNAIYIYGGNADTLGANWIYDGNTVQRAYWQSVFLLYTDFLSVSNNTSIAMSNINYTTSGWWGLYFFRSNADVIKGNKIHGQGRVFTDPRGMYFYYLNVNKAPADIYNNEIILARSGASTANAFIFEGSSSGNIYHNSIYVVDTATSAYAALYINTDKVTNVKNNNLIATRSPAVVVWSNVTTLDYNNYYAKIDTIGAYNGTILKNIPDWQSVSGQDANSVSVYPKFADLMQSMEIIDSFAYIGCPVLPTVVTDINNIPRQYDITAMGAYELLPAPGLTVKHRLIDFPQEAVINQTVSVDVEMINYGSTPVTEVLLAYSFNNGTPLTYQWTPATAFSPLSNPIVLNIKNFYMQTDTTLKIWVTSVNGIANSLTDTVTAFLKLIPLVEFIPPYIKDTLLNTREFDIHAKIIMKTGAPTMPPVLQIKSMIEDTIFFDNIPMVLNNDAWTASVPSQYYNSKIIYWLTVSDSIGGSVTAMDSVYLLANLGGGSIVGGGSTDTVIIGTGTSGHYYIPASMYFRTSWTRQIYLYEEICPDLSPLGTIITSIAWYSNNINYTYSKQTCYMRAITDSIENTGYIDPLSNGAKQVWTGTMNISPGWVEIVLDTAFFLPPGENLEIFWIHRDSTYPGSTYYWAYTPTPTGQYRAIYAQNDAGFPSTATGTRTLNRSNIKITKKLPFQPYAGYNLGFLSMVSPVYSLNNLCEPDYSPVQVLLGNLGESTYDFSTDSITIGYEITDPFQTVYNGSVSVNKGELRMGATNTVELMTAFPILSGKSTVKAWIINSTDPIKYDDTIRYTYVSAKLGLPVDEYFSGNTMPDAFMAFSNDTNRWQVYIPDGDFAVQPDFGTGMLRFAGEIGKIAKLSTSHQLDLYGAVNPKLEFWYYHDSTVVEQDNSYTDVNIIVDDVSYTVLYLLKRSKVYHGWTQYTVDLSKYITAQCVLIEFESMNRYGKSEQYIDRIHITSEEDLEISKIMVSPQVTLCDLTSKNVHVVITTKTAQAINFSNYSTSLAVEIPGRSTVYHSLQGIMQGRISDTISIASNVDFSIGANQIRAYLTSPVDNYNGNDTAIFRDTINPEIMVTAQSISGGVTDCLSKGTMAQQAVWVKNTGNKDIPAISLILKVDASSPQIIYGLSTGNLPPGDSVEVIFDDYKVPAEASYYVEITAYMSCDSTIVNHKIMVRECVDMDDLSIARFVKPESGQTDTIGINNEIAVYLKNGSDVITYHDVVITALIEANGTEITRLRDVVPEINYSDSVLFIFASKYTVPDESEYTIRVFINKVDNYPINDTISLERETVEGDVGVRMNESGIFTLKQNIPNPANNSTLIEYSIPAGGEVTFNVYSINGQLLYTKVMQPGSGRHTIDLNTSSFAAGVYLYSIEYDGQKLVKRMSIKR